MHDENWIHNFSDYIRKQFPSMSNDVDGDSIVYLDGPGGYQVPQSVIGAMDDYLVNSNSNAGGQFKTSRETDELISEARGIFADFFNSSHDEVIFGANMTTLNFMLAQALRKQLEPGEKILITQLDHAGNRSPWEELEADGVVVEEVTMDPDALTLDMDDFRSKLTENTRLVAVTHASNAVGTVPDVKQIVTASHDVGAYTVVDAVHYAAHFPIDVKDMGTDFLLCSSYKFFGPHMGVMYAQREIMSELDTLKVRPAEDTPPYKFETGTLNHEGIAGANEAVQFIADVGEQFSPKVELGVSTDSSERRTHILAGLKLFEAYEEILTDRLIDGLSDIPELTLYRPPADSQSTSTVSFTHEMYTPTQIASYLGDRGIFVWDGDFYATRVVEVLGLQDEGGLVRIGISPYNTLDGIDRTVNALNDAESLHEALG